MANFIMYLDRLIECVVCLRGVSESPDSETNVT